MALGADNNNKKIRLTLLDKVNVVLEQFGDHVMHLVFAPEKMLDAERFSRALRLSLDAEPILGCRLVDGVLYPRWIRWEPQELDRFELCRVVTAVDVHEQVHAFLLQTMDCRVEPMVQARIFRSEHDVVCLNVSCVPIDGRGLLIYLERVFRIYDRLADMPDHIPPSSGFGLRSTAALVRYFRWWDVFGLLLHGLRNQWQDRRTAHNWKFPVRASTHMARAFHHYQFQPATLDVIEAYRRQHGVTFNDILLAAFYHALQRIIKPESGTECCVLNTYDLRRYEKALAPDRVANYSSFVNCNVRLERGLGFQSLILRVRAAMTERKRHFPGITEGPFIWPLFRFVPFALARRVVAALLQHRGESIPVLTNVGVIDIQKLRLDGMPLRWLLPYAPLEYPPKLTVTLATVGRRVTLSLGYSRSHFDEQQVKDLFVQMEAVILQECVVHPLAAVMPAQAEADLL